MNQKQQIAISNHCRFAFETAQPKLCFLDEDGKVSVVLSVNSGYE